MMSYSSIFNRKRTDSPGNRLPQRIPLQLNLIEQLAQRIGNRETRYAPLQRIAAEVDTVVEEGGMEAAVHQREAEAGTDTPGDSGLSSDMHIIRGRQSEADLIIHPLPDAR